MNLCVIPARGGSKRIPRKNIREFCGKPMIAHAIEAAKASRIFDCLLVSTDSEEIGQIARSYGADIPLARPRHLADDYATTAAVVRHAIETLQRVGTTFSTVFCIYATNPFLRPNDLQHGHALLTKYQAPAAYTITSFPCPIQRALRVNQYGELEMIWPEHRLTRSQDLPPAYHDAGQFYCAQVAQFLKHGRFSMEGARPIMLPRYLVHDLDTEEDWDIAERYFRSNVVAHPLS